MKRRILLVEPSYKVKYPPLGLMKLATAHELLGDEVCFCRGKDKGLRAEDWGRIYVSTLFTFHWRVTIDTIRFYSKASAQLMVGGPTATLMPEQIRAETGIKPYQGALVGDVAELVKAARRVPDLSLLLSEIEKRGIDALPPHYGLFSDCDVPYGKVLKEFYLLRTTQGCPRQCPFCSALQRGTDSGRP